MQKFNDESHWDVFHAFLVKNAEYAGTEEFPIIRTSNLLPERIIPFSKALSSSDTNAWVAFYESDYRYECVWKSARQYLGLLKRFRGVISPDFSLYRDMPLCMQKWSTYKGRALAHWWQENGIEIIPNVRFSDARSYDFCFDGIDRESTIAIGTFSCFKNKTETEFFRRGLEETVEHLRPKTILVCGKTPEEIFGKYIESGIDVRHFDGTPFAHFPEEDG